MQAQSACASTAKETSARNLAPKRSLKSYCRSKSGGDNPPMKLIASFGALLIISSLQADDKKIIRDKSPDGRFALQITKDEQGSSAFITDLKGKADSVDLEIYQNYTEQMHLVWSRIHREWLTSSRTVAVEALPFTFGRATNLKQSSCPKFPSARTPRRKGKSTSRPSRPRPSLNNG